MCATGYLLVLLDESSHLVLLGRACWKFGTRRSWLVWTTSSGGRRCSLQRMWTWVLDGACVSPNTPPPRKRVSGPLVLSAGAETLRLVASAQNMSSS